MLPLS
ncbi:hypothetical protein D030_1331A, partial [Vibrio parahaemolyticus AQ3810]